MSTCSVCLLGFNKTVRLQLACPTCAVPFCRSCLQHYALTNLTEPFRCVNAPACTGMWDREFLDTHTTGAFRAVTYKAHREKVLKDREQSRLPSTQEDAIALRDARRIYADSKAEITRLRESINELHTRMYQAERRSVVSKEVVQSMGRLRMPEVNTLSWDSAAIGVDTKKERAAFVKPCPAPSCKGFLSTAWKCGLCETRTCAECHDWKGESNDTEHTCDPNKVATARLLAREAKSCPKCGVSICKINGCDMMFCVACNTGFNWRTGKLHQGAIHNPHYFEWLRRTGHTEQAAAPVDPGALCGNNLDRAIAAALGGRRARPYRYMDNPDQIIPSPTATKEDRYLLEAWRIMREEEDNDRAEDSVEEIFRILRVKYLCDEYTADTWPVALQRAEKNAAVRQAKADLRGVYIAGARDIIRQLLAPEADKVAIKKQVEELVVYCNKCREEAAARFNRIMPPLKIQDRVVAERERRRIANAATATVPVPAPVAAETTSNVVVTEAVTAVDALPS